MLATVGLLTEEQRQAVVALLGGVTSCRSTTTNSTITNSTTTTGSTTTFCSTLLPEPADLVEWRQQGSISLAELSVALLLWPSAYTTEAGALSAATQLVMAFGAEQLPLVAAVASAKQQQDLPLLPKATVDTLADSTLSDTYFSWVQACLLSIINDVLRQAGVRTAGVRA
jgi:hypothetical protein